MKKCYFGILLLLTMVSYGQDSDEATKNLYPKQEASFKLYPNPVLGDVVYITTTSNSPKKIVIYDIFGEIVLTDRIKTKALNISRLVAGVYVLQVTINNETLTRKLIVK